MYAATSDINTYDRYYYLVFQASTIFESDSNCQLSIKATLMNLNIGYLCPVLTSSYQ
ncbi:hypothetical protein SAMN05216167_10696 [Spirosoma endophyticum]|uniref:Uncharacterized protein n=1 Tax=Spirosoma endophyticum TaxID=662367 RepID=A0A1I1U5N8_9BACT|nr:hypothetical protein SAMN05216167_10696 [Spirosoma endophyticum]